MGEGSTRDHDPERIVVSGALCACSDAACRGRGVRDRVGSRVSERERGGGERSTEGKGSGVERWGRPARSLVGCCSVLLGLLARASAGPVGLASAGPVGLARAWVFSYFFNYDRERKLI